MLWEDSFYESGVSIAERIRLLVPRCRAQEVADLAVEARSVMHLRHVPLLLCDALACYPDLQQRTAIKLQTVLSTVIQRPDELTEFLAIYWPGGDRRGNPKKLSNPVRLGLANAITKFNAYSLAKYNRDGIVKLKDIIRLCHPVPKDPEQALAFKQIIDGTLPSPDTWEVALSSGADPLATWTRLIEEGKLGGLATLRNLRNMQKANVPPGLIKTAILKANYDRVLPFRFIAAALHGPQFEPELEHVLFARLAAMAPLSGRTVVWVDCSGSMSGALSAKSDMSRRDAACALAICARELCSEVMVGAFATDYAPVPPRRGFALRDILGSARVGYGTNIGGAVSASLSAQNPPDRMIVITDDQSHDQIPAGNGKCYMLNVAAYQNGLGYGNGWTTITGFSENVLRYIQQMESEQ